MHYRLHFAQVVASFEAGSTAKVVSMFPRISSALRALSGKIYISSDMKGYEDPVREKCEIEFVIFPQES